LSGPVGAASISSRRNGGRESAGWVRRRRRPRSIRSSADRLRSRRALKADDDLRTSVGRLVTRSVWDGVILFGRRPPFDLELLPRGLDRVRDEWCERRAAFSGGGSWSSVDEPTASTQSQLTTRVAHVDRPMEVRGPSGVDSRPHRCESALLSVRVSGGTPMATGVAPAIAGEPCEHAARRHPALQPEMRDLRRECHWDVWYRPEAS
jgi:hypothetical protein